MYDIVLIHNKQLERTHRSDGLVRIQLQMKKLGQKNVWKFVP